MPSPIAHSAVALALWPALKLDQRSPVPSRSRWIVGGMLVFMCCGADIDFIPHLLMDAPDAWQHGGATHSLVVGVFAATAFAMISRMIVPVSWVRLLIVGCLAWWSHVLLDYFTPGGGVMVFWPFIEERFVSPIPLFFGAEHSQPLAIHLHLITFITELPFVLLMWLLGRGIRRWQQGP